QRIMDLGDVSAAHKSVETFGSSPAGGSTSLYDALISALIVPLEVNRRQMAIVFTDGVDVSSFMVSRDVLDVAARSGVTVFAVSLAEANVLGTRPETEGIFEQLARTTGGVFASIERNEDLSQSFVKAFEEFGTSYVLRYTPTGTPKPGWHDLSVRVT